MIEIPEQLRDFRFVLLRPRSKEAYEGNWQMTANYAYNDPQLLKHLTGGGNYGVIALDHIVVETDSPDLEAIVERELPPTFTQRSPGHYSKHFFFNGVSKIIPLFDKSKPKNKANVGHVKSGPSYVVGPGSRHPNGGLYEIIDRRPVASITEEDVQRVLAQFVAQRALTEEKREARKYHSSEFIDIVDLLGGLGLQERSGQLQGPHPVHGSETGLNFSVNPRLGVWHCFRCNSGGGAWSLLAVLEGVLDCQDAVPGALRGQLFKRTREIALERQLIKRNIPIFTNTDEKPQLAEDAQPHEVAEAILGTLRVHTIFRGEVYIYDGGVYRPGGEGIVRRTVELNCHKAGVDKKASGHFVNEVVGHIERRTYTKPDVFDRDPMILNLQNGLFNIDTCELHGHSPDYPSLGQLPVKYDPSADCPNWKLFLEQIHYPEDLHAVQEYIGSLLVRHYKTQKAWLQVGEGGNGKDTEDRVLTALLGSENVAHRSLQELEIDRFARADLHGKLANIYSDLPDASLKTTGIFKTLTGEGQLSAQRKFQNSFSFYNYAKLIFSCNKIPASPDDSDAFYRRWFPTTYPRQFLGSAADPKLVERLTTPEELSGILNWAIDGLRRLRAQNWQLSQSRSLDEIREDYVRKSDPVKAFVMDCCQQDPDGTVPKQVLFQGFIRYCGQRKLPPPTSDTFFKRLPMAGVPVTLSRLGKDRVPSVKGLWLRSPEYWGQEVTETEKPVLDQASLDLTLSKGDPGNLGNPGSSSGATPGPPTPPGGQPPKVEGVGRVTYERIGEDSK